ncbi:MAG: PAS domain-containing protein [Planctomycetes bacterium]|nr:PAS domain-containing protein [Planctomycetota bacterium]
MPGVAYICENDGLYTMRYITPTLRSVLGYEPADFIDNKRHFAASVILPEDLDVVDEFAEIVAKADIAVTARYRLVRASGEVFQALVFAHALRDPKTKEPVGFCGVLTDISGVPSLQGESAVLTQAKYTSKERKTPKRKRR